MKLKFAFVTLVFALLSTIGYSQDKIYKRDGRVLEVKIKNVGIVNIIYVKMSNITGPEYSVPKSEVEKIKYENGSEETFKPDATYVDNNNGGGGLWRNNNPYVFMPNVLAFAPIQLTENGIAGVSLSYEHAIDKNGILSFYLPLILEFNTNTPGNTNNSDPMLYFMPGIKIYPTGSFGMAKYAIGPSVVIANGEKTGAGYDASGNPISYMAKSHFLLGMMLNQSVNINPTPHFYLGSEFGFGYTYIDKVGGVKQGVNGLVQFSIKIGYRYGAKVGPKVIDESHSK